MQKIVIDGGRPLKGTVKISGAKNAALPCLFATLLTDQVCRLENIPQLRDINTTLELLTLFDVIATNGRTTGTSFGRTTGTSFGRTTGTSFGRTTGTSFGRQYLSIDPRRVRHVQAPYELVKTMRASVLCLGPLLARHGKAEVSLPGGCAIGARPINLHLAALQKMGAQIEIEEGYVKAQSRRLHGTKIHFDDVTVTGTENIMMAAALAKGETLLENAAQEPEIPDLADFLNAMGAKIKGAGTNTIHIQGVDRLSGATHTVIPDRIEMGTFMIAAAITGGEILLEGGRPDHVEALTAKLQEAGTTIKEVSKGLLIKGAKAIEATNVSTAPFPGFATDFQAQFMALMTLAKGSSVIVENIFENRFVHVAELTRMGAEIKTEGSTAVIKGVDSLSGAPVMASDLRASAALLLAGLAADGITEVHRIYHIDRGYERIERKLKKLGARIKRVQVKF